MIHFSKWNKGDFKIVAYYENERFKNRVFYCTLLSQWMRCSCWEELSGWELVGLRATGFRCCWKRWSVGTGERAVRLLLGWGGHLLGQPATSGAPSVPRRWQRTKITLGGEELRLIEPTAAPQLRIGLVAPTAVEGSLRACGKLLHAEAFPRPRWTRLQCEFEMHVGGFRGSGAVVVGELPRRLPELTAAVAVAAEGPPKRDSVAASALRQSWMKCFLGRGTLFLPDLHRAFCKHIFESFFEEQEIISDADPTWVPGCPSRPAEVGVMAPGRSPRAAKFVLPKWKNSSNQAQMWCNVDLQWMVKFLQSLEANPQTWECLSWKERNSTRN